MERLIRHPLPSKGNPSRQAGVQHNRARDIQPGVTIPRHDLRAIVTSLQNIADVERMGGLALHVAKIARRRHPAHVLPEEVNGYFAEMGRLAVKLGSTAQEVVLSRDPRRAAQIRQEDDAMDELHRHLFGVLMDPEWKHGVAVAVDVTLLGRFYERFADHTVAIGRRVIFHATGPNHRNLIEAPPSPVMQCPAVKASV